MTEVDEIQVHRCPFYAVLHAHFSVRMPCQDAGRDAAAMQCFLSGLSEGVGTTMLGQALHRSIAILPGLRA